MKKSILLVGQQASGKTTKIKQLLSQQQTDFVLDGAVSPEEIEAVHLNSLKENSFAIVSTQLAESVLPKELLSNFEIVRCVRSL